MLAGGKQSEMLPMNDLMSFLGVAGQKKRLFGEPAFIYKFKEGHSKNFKKELEFGYFLAK